VVGFLGPSGFWVCTVLGCLNHGLSNLHVFIVFLFVCVCVMYRNVADTLRDIMYAMVTYPMNDDRWIFVVPLYHLLSNAVKPFSRTALQSSTSHQDPQWWGIADFTDLVERFKKIQRATM